MIDNLLKKQVENFFETRNRTEKNQRKTESCSKLISKTVPREIGLTILQQIK